MNDPASKPSTSIGMRFYLKHLAIAFGIGVLILGVTLLVLRITYGSLTVPGSVIIHKVPTAAPSSAPAGGRQGP